MDERTITINVSFSNNFSNKSTSVSFEVRENDFTVSEYVEYMKKVGLVYGFTPTQMASITGA